MLYAIGSIIVSGFRKSAGSILQSWAEHFTDQNINALKIAKNSKTIHGNYLRFGQEQGIHISYNVKKDFLKIT